MNKVILDSYYMINLHLKNNQEINTFRLNNLLYIANAYYIAKNNGKVLYSSGFYLGTSRNL